MVTTGWFHRWTSNQITTTQNTISLAMVLEWSYKTNLKLHKLVLSGSVPDGFPIKYLPADYGGEQPSVEELDAKCKSLISKYARWLRETEVYKVDESKRPKKSWWESVKTSAFNHFPIDKETLMRNLQWDWPRLIIT